MLGVSDLLKKRGKFYFIIILLFGVVLFSFPASAQNACINIHNEPPTPRLNACGVPITVQGHGAVELCNECFVCGVPDGVCPEVYSDGYNETTKIIKREVMMRVGSDRPAGSNVDFRVMFNTANDACASIAGTCTGNIYTKEREGNSWIFAGIGCGDDVRLSNNYYKVECEAVPRTSGCENCPDPDCTTELRGITYAAGTQALLDNVVVTITSDSNSGILATTTSSGGGEYSMINGVRGNVKVVCTLNNYAPVVKNVYLQPGKNIVDCAMSAAMCTPNCTLPDPIGRDVCRASCHLINGCFFQNDSTYGFIGNICDGIEHTTFVPLNRTNQTHVAGVDCCLGQVVYRPSPLFEPKGDLITNLITRDYRKEIFGLPVTLKIMVYDKR